MPVADAAPIPLGLIESLRSARRICVFSGAGMSAESGVPTFRDALTGLWERFDAERLATPEAFHRDPSLVWGWYEWRRMKMRLAQPHAGHRALAGLERRAAQLTVITQNVDDLHERAGNTNVLHLHGSLEATRCVRCAAPFELPADIPQEPEGGRRIEPPRCASCGGRVRPGVVWFGESLPMPILQQAHEAAAACDAWITVGTSGLVYPAAELPLVAARAGATLVQINPLPTPLDAHYDHVLSGTAAQCLPELFAQERDRASLQPGRS